MSEAADDRHLIGPTSVTATADLLSRAPTAVDAEALAALMLDAYQGTVDADGSETIEVARAEVARFLAGESGPPLLEMSQVVEEQDRPVAAVLVSHYQGLPLIAYVMTAASHKRRGLANGLLRVTLAALAASGEQRAHLWVTSANPAVRLYERLGFKDMADPAED